MGRRRSKRPLPPLAQVVDFEFDFQGPLGDENNTSTQCGGHLLGHASRASIQLAWDEAKDKSAPIRGFAKTRDGVGATYLISSSKAFRAVKSDDGSIVYTGAYIADKPGRKFTVVCNEFQELCNVFSEGEKLERDNPDSLSRRNLVERHHLIQEEGRGSGIDGEDDKPVHRTLLSCREGIDLCCSDSDCGSSKPVCEVNYFGFLSCSECRSNTECPSSKPYCETDNEIFLCQPCLQDCDCGSGYVCNQDDAAHFCEEDNCFSAASTVTVLGKGKIPMKELAIGDVVEVAPGGKFERVYGFGHRDENKAASFLRIYTDRNSGKPLEITTKHMLFVGGSAVPASQVAVGDSIDLAGKGSGSAGYTLTAEVVKIAEVTRTDGVYNPFTPSGTIIVDGIVASVYASLQGTKYLEVAGIRTPFTHQALSHAFMGVQRAACSTLNFERYCKSETYEAETGLSKWVAVPSRATRFALRQNALFQAVFFSLCLALLLVFVVTEAALTINGAVLFSIGIVPAAIRHRKDARSKKISFQKSI